MVSSTAAAQLAPLLPLLPLLGSAAAAAEDLSLDDVDRDAAYAAEFSQTTGSTDLVVSVLAGSVFLLLLVVTAGVSYLTLKSWLDERQENDDREGSAKKPAAGFRDAAAAPEPEAPKRVRAKREKTKGFGQN